VIKLLVKFTSAHAVFKTIFMINMVFCGVQGAGC